MAKMIRGTFKEYAGPSNAKYPPDEAAVAAACELMLQMCGNPGQEALIGDYLEEFSAWALWALESALSIEGKDFSDFGRMVLMEWYDNRKDKWLATDRIWGHGWHRIAFQSGYHDSFDEMGEGTGQEFG